MTRKTILGTFAASLALAGSGLAGCTSDQGSDAPSEPSRHAEENTKDPRAGKEKTGGRSDGGPGRPADGGAPDGQAGGVRVTVQRIVDGDTLVVSGDGNLLPARDVRVRLLEVDTPEVGACFAGKATARAATLLPAGSTVRVERDEDLKDPYGRYLLYVWNGQGRFVNLALVDGGFAKAVLYPPNDRYWPQISAAGETAEAAEAGLWAGCEKNKAPRNEGGTPGPAEPGKPDRPKSGGQERDQQQRETQPERQPEREPRSPDTPEPPPEPDTPEPEVPEPDPPEPDTPAPAEPGAPTGPTGAE